MSRKKGDIAEEKALNYLLENAFVLIERNFYSRFGEIDIIATKDNVLHFIEVKSGQDYELAVRNITKTKLQKLIKTGDIYLKKNAISISYVYDALIVVDESVELIENITI